jgi:hypothetical protein
MKNLGFLGHFLKIYIPAAQPEPKFFVLAPALALAKFCRSTGSGSATQQNSRVHCKPSRAQRKKISAAKSNENAGFIQLH